MSLSVTITGTKEVIANLEALKSSVQKRLIEGAGRAALKPVVADVRGRVPKNTGTLRKSIGVKKAKRSPKGEVVLSVGARWGYEWTDAKGKKHNPFFYAIPIEFGHDIKNPETGQVVAHVPPVSMFRSAYERWADQIIATFETELIARMDAIA